MILITCKSSYKYVTRKGVSQIHRNYDISLDKQALNKTGMHF